MKPLYIFDLDGTLALIDHRRHLVQEPACPHCGWVKTCDHSRDGTRPVFKPDWPAFYAACVDDVPNQPVISIMNSLMYAAASIRIFSGRSDEVREQTVEWLTKHTPLRKRELHSSMLRMRQQGDYTPDDVLKKQWLDELSSYDRKRLVAVFDDRDKVVKMWRDNGVACFQVAPGEF